ncbi:MAG: caspase family protein [Myxococcota bacterium]
MKRLIRALDGARSTLIVELEMEDYLQRREPDLQGAHKALERARGRLGRTHPVVLRMQAFLGIVQVGRAQPGRDLRWNPGFRAVEQALDDLLVTEGPAFPGTLPVAEWAVVAMTKAGSLIEATKLQEEVSQGLSELEGPGSQAHLRFESARVRWLLQTGQQDQALRVGVRAVAAARERYKATAPTVTHLRAYFSSLFLSSGLSSGAFQTDISSLVQDLEPKAQANDVEAMIMLAELSDLWLGNEEKALSLLRKAADLGSAEAAYRFAKRMKHERPRRRETRELERTYLTKASEGGHPKAMVALGSQLSRRAGKRSVYEESQRLFTRAAEAGEASGWILLAILHLESSFSKSGPDELRRLVANGAGASPKVFQELFETLCATDEQGLLMDLAEVARRGGARIHGLHHDSGPLFEAAASGNMRYLEYLIEAGIDVDSGRTPVLHELLSACDEDEDGQVLTVVQRLIAAGASTRAVPQEHGTLLHLVSSSCRETLQGLLSAGLQGVVNETNLRGHTALHVHGCDFESDPETLVLDDVPGSGNRESSRILLEAGADPFMVSPDGFTPADCLIDSFGREIFAGLDPIPAGPGVRRLHVVEEDWADEDLQSVKPPELVISNQDGPVQSAAFSRGHDQLLTFDGSHLNLWDVATGLIVRRFRGASLLNDRPKIGFSGDDLVYLSTEILGSPTLWMWNKTTGALVLQATSPQNDGLTGSSRELGEFYSSDLMAVAPSSGRMLTIGGRGLELRTLPNFLAALEGQEDSIPLRLAFEQPAEWTVPLGESFEYLQGVGLSASGDAVWVYTDKRLRVWRRGIDAPIHEEVILHSDRFDEIQLSSDGRWVAVQHSDRIRLLDTKEKTGVQIPSSPDSWEMANDRWVVIRETDRTDVYDFFGQLKFSTTDAAQLVWTDGGTWLELLWVNQNTASLKTSVGLVKLTITNGVLERVDAGRDDPRVLDESGHELTLETELESVETIRLHIGGEWREFTLKQLKAKASLRNQLWYELRVRSEDGAVTDTSNIPVHQFGYPFLASERGRHLIAVGGFSMELWSGRRPSRVKRFKLGQSRVGGAAVSRDETLLYIGSRRHLTVYRLCDGAKLQTFDFPDVGEVRVSPDGKRLLLLRYTGEAIVVVVADAATGQVISSHAAKPGSWAALASSGAAFVLSDRDGIDIRRTNEPHRSVALLKTSKLKAVERSFPPSIVTNDVGDFAVIRLEGEVYGVDLNRGRRTWSASEMAHAPPVLGPWQEVQGPVIGAYAVTADGAHTFASINDGLAKIRNSDGRTELLKDRISGFVRELPEALAIEREGRVDVLNVNTLVFDETLSLSDPENLSLHPDGTIGLNQTSNSVEVWDRTQDRRLATLIHFDKSASDSLAWVWVADDGRFDTDDFLQLDNLAWRFAERPLHPAPLSLYAEYYTPGLVARSEQLGAFKNLPSRTSDVPIASIIRVDRNSAENAVSIEVDARAVGESGLDGIRLYRDAQLVAWYAPVTKSTSNAKLRRTFRVKLPSGAAGTSSQFTVLALNRDGAPGPLSKAKDVELQPSRRRPKAWVVTVGVSETLIDEYSNTAAAQAAELIGRRYLRALERSHSVERIRLQTIAFNEDPGSRIPPTKTNIRDTLLRLGRSSKGQASPDDLLVFHFVGHGVEVNEELYLVPEETSVGHESPEFEHQAISAQELSDWLRDIDVRRMLVLIDACFSEAIAKRFRPAPFGDPGLGALAYEKRALVLTASQSEAMIRGARTVLSSPLQSAQFPFGLTDGTTLESLLMELDPKDTVCMESAPRVFTRPADGLQTLPMTPISVQP